jgi:hypothetical protein
MKAIYKMTIDCGRMGDLYGQFVATKEAIAELIGTEVYFGEVLGKHSEVNVVMKEKYFQMVTDDQKVVEMFEKYNFSSGYCPFDYIDYEAYNAMEEAEMDENNFEENNDE